MDFILQLAEQLPDDVSGARALVYALGAFTLGAAITWLLRGVALKRTVLQRDDLTARLEVQDREFAHQQGELHRLLEQTESLENRLDQLQRERERLLVQHSQMNERLRGDREKHGEQLALLEKSREQLKVEFEHLAHRIFEERGQQFSNQNQQSMEALLKPFGEQIHRFQTRINEVHEQSVRGNEHLAGELRQLLGVGLKMSDQAENLARALKGDKKTTGNWGEVQLERTLQLAGLERGTHYEAQVGHRDAEGRTRIPDFVINLPDGKHLIIDSKVSLVDYDRAVAAETDEERAEALKAHTQALKRHIDDLASKDYAGLGALDSPELVFLFMPIEAAYIEALKFNRELFNEGYRKNVVMVSHTTLLPMLRTVASLWIAYRSNQEARAISEMAGEIYNKVCLVGQRLDDMGRTLSTVTGKYNQTVTALVGKQGLYGKVERFKGAAANAKGELPTPQDLHPNIEHDRLGVFDETTAPFLQAVDDSETVGNRECGPVDHHIKTDGG